MKGKDKDILQIFPEYMRPIWTQAVKYSGQIQEIRLRAGREILIYMDGKEYFLNHDGNFEAESEQAVRIERTDLEQLISYVCSNSVYAFEDEISRGYLTLPGGHRMGLAGEAVLENNGSLRTIRNYSAVNIRISHEVKGAADHVLKWLYDGKRFLNTLIVSPPCCGKTTLLRDVIRQVSEGNEFAKGMTVGVVDERSEIGGSFQGIPQNDVGKRTDVLDGCPKAVGMMMLIRAMSPSVIAVDELGSEEEMKALQRVLQCGCKILATMHAETAGEAVERMSAGGMESSFFERFLVLDRVDGKCRIKEVLNRSFQKMDDLLC